jgi:peptidoglycan DL-endopeptidase CwlO
MALWYVPPLVRGLGRGLRTFVLAVAATSALVATLAGGGAAENADELERRAEALRLENRQLAAGARSAVAELATIESRLTRTRVELASFRARARDVRTRRRAVRAELTVVRSALRATQEALARRLQSIYEDGEADTLAVVLGAQSLDEALSAIETIDLAATQDKGLLERARSASSRLAALGRRLAARERDLEQLAAVRAAAAAALADARADRLRLIAAARSAKRSNGAEIAALQKRARMLASANRPAPVSPGVHSLTVAATAYALPGRTATGRTAGWGSVAVDPSVIPLGSRLRIPGYGFGVASDVGSAIQGARIDVWFPTESQALEWGNRVVTIAIYSD